MDEIEFKLSSWIIEWNDKDNVVISIDDMISWLKDDRHPMSADQRYLANQLVDYLECFKMETLLDHGFM